MGSLREPRFRLDSLEATMGSSSTKMFLEAWLVTVTTLCRRPTAALDTWLSTEPTVLGLGRPLGRPDGRQVGTLDGRSMPEGTTPEGTQLGTGSEAGRAAAVDARTAAMVKDFILISESDSAVKAVKNGRYRTG